MLFVAHRPHHERKAPARLLESLHAPLATLIQRARIFFALAAFLFLEPSLIMRVRVSVRLTSIPRWQDTSSEACAYFQNLCCLLAGAIWVKAVINYWHLLSNFQATRADGSQLR